MQLRGCKREMCQEAFYMMGNPVALKRWKGPVHQQCILFDVGLVECLCVEKKAGEECIDKDVINAVASEGDAPLVRGSTEVEMTCPEGIGADSEHLPYAEDVRSWRYGRLAKERENLLRVCGSEQLRQEKGQ
jgi:hypothetical protein